MRDTINTMKIVKFKTLFIILFLGVVTCLYSCDKEDEVPFWNIEVKYQNGDYFTDLWTSCDEQTIHLTVESTNCWEIGETRGVTITPMSGNRGVTEITLHINENTSNNQKEKYFSIRNTEQQWSEDHYTIYQKGVLHLHTNPDSFKLPKENGSVTATITTNIEGLDFEIETPIWARTEWIDHDIDDNGDIRTHVLKIKYDYNPNELRTGNIVIKSTTTDLSNYIHLIQNGAQGASY